MPCAFVPCALYLLLDTVISMPAVCRPRQAGSRSTVPSKTPSECIVHETLRVYQAHQRGMSPWTSRQNAYCGSLTHQTHLSHHTEPATLVLCRHLEEILGLGTVGALQGRVKRHMAAAGLSTLLVTSNTSAIFLTQRLARIMAVCLRALAESKAFAVSPPSLPNPTLCLPQPQEQTS